MAKKTDLNSISKESDSSLGGLMTGVQLLPGESVKQYKKELKLLLGEIQSGSPLAAMLTKELYASIVWARRHSLDKAAIVLDAMADVISGGIFGSDHILVALKVLSIDPANEEASDLIDARLSQMSATMEGVRALAIQRSIKDLETLDSLISQHLNTARHLQKSIESLELKPRLLKRLDLQIESLERDVNALPHEQ